MRLFLWNFLLIWPIFSARCRSVDGGEEKMRELQSFGVQPPGFSPPREGKGGIRTFFTRSLPRDRQPPCPHGHRPWLKVTAIRRRVSKSHDGVGIPKPAPCTPSPPPPPTPPSQQEPAPKHSGLRNSPVFRVWVFPAELGKAEKADFLLQIAPLCSFKATRQPASWRHGGTIPISTPKSCFLGAEGAHKGGGILG